MQIVHPLFTGTGDDFVYEISDEDREFLQELEALETADEMRDLINGIELENKRIEAEEKAKAIKKGRRWR